MLRPDDPKEKPCASAWGASVAVSKPIASIGVAIHLIGVDMVGAFVDDMRLIGGPTNARKLGLCLEKANSVPMACSDGKHQGRCRI